MRALNRYNNYRTPDMGALRDIAREMLGDDLTDEEANQALGWSDFHLFLIQEIESRWIKPSTREFVGGLKDYLPNLSPNQQISLFNTYSTVKDRRKV